MGLCAGFQPFLINQLAGKKLSQRLCDLALLIHGEHAKRGTGVVAAGMHTERYVMKVVEPVASSGEKGADVIGEPERTEDIDGGLRGAGRNVSLGNEHG